jgi:putative phage-type endonuclease
MVAELIRMGERARRPSREEWLGWRRQGIGGSDAAAIVGLSPYSGPMRVWLEKRGLIEGADESEAMLWGSLLEGSIADEFERRTGLRVVARQALRMHPEHPWMRCTLDGLVAEHEHDPADLALGIFESKSAGDGFAWGDEPPPHALLQVQHSLAVTGLERAWVAVLHGGRGGMQLRTYELEADAELQAYLIEEERAFWQLVETGKPPPADSSEETAAALRAAYAEPVKLSSVDLPGRALDLVQQYRSAKEDERAAAARAALAQNELMSLLGEAEIGLLDGAELVTWRQYESKRVDLDALRDKHPKLVARFTRTDRSRRFAIRKGTES